MENSSIAVESPPEVETAPVSGAPESFDFHNPGHSIREGIRRLESAHEAFSGRLERALSDSFGATVRLSLQGIQQTTFARYLRTLPTPGLIGVMDLAPFHGTVMMEISAEVGLPLVEVMLGGLVESGLERKPTALERELLQNVGDEAVTSLGMALEPLGLSVEVRSWEADGQFIDAEDELAILVKYAVAFSEEGAPHDRLVLTYPLSALQSIAEGKFDISATEGGLAVPGVPTDVSDHLPEVHVPFVVRLQPSTVAFEDVADLRPGDVLRLDHAIDDPVVGLVGTRPVVAGKLGTKKNKLALEISGWIDS